MTIVQNSPESLYANKFKRSNIEQFNVGQFDQIAKNENITVNWKETKGRLLSKKNNREMSKKFILYYEYNSKIMKKILRFKY